MSIIPILAEDIPPTVLLFVLVPLFLAILAIFGLRRMVVAGGSGGGIRWGIAKRLIPVLGGGLFLFSLLTVRGGVPFSFYVVSAIPMIIGLWSLYFFGRKTAEAARPVSITLRVLLLGFLGLAFIGLCAKLLAK